MNAQAAVLLILLAPTALCATPPVVVQLETGLVVTPFAIPVATPVAVLAPANILYRVAPYDVFPAQHSVSQQSPTRDQQLWNEFEQFRQWKQSRASQSPLTTPPLQKQFPLIKQSCLQCHSGTNPKGNLSLDANPPQHIRLRAIRAIITGQMPPESTLTPQQRGKLLLELATSTNQTKSSQSPGTPQ